MESAQWRQIGIEAGRAVAAIALGAAAEFGLVAAADALTEHVASGTQHCVDAYPSADARGACRHGKSAEGYALGGILIAISSGVAAYSGVIVLDSAAAIFKRRENKGDSQPA